MQELLQATERARTQLPRAVAADYRRQRRAKSLLPSKLVSQIKPASQQNGQQRGLLPQLKCNCPFSTFPCDIIGAVHAASRRNSEHFPSSCTIPLAGVAVTHWSSCLIGPAQLSRQRNSVSECVFAHAAGVLLHWPDPFAIVLDTACFDVHVLSIQSNHTECGSIESGAVVILSQLQLTLYSPALLEHYFHIFYYISHLHRWGMFQIFALCPVCILDSSSSSGSMCANGRGILPNNSHSACH